MKPIIAAVVCLAVLLFSAPSVAPAAAPLLRATLTPAPYVTPAPTYAPQPTATEAAYPAPEKERHHSSPRPTTPPDQIRQGSLCTSAACLANRAPVDAPAPWGPEK